MMFWSCDLHQMPVHVAPPLSDQLFTFGLYHSQMLFLCSHFRCLLLFFSVHLSNDHVREGKDWYVNFPFPQRMHCVSQPLRPFFVLLFWCNFENGTVLLWKVLILPSYQKSLTGACNSECDGRYMNWRPKSSAWSDYAGSTPTFFHFR